MIDSFDFDPKELKAEVKQIQDQLLQLRGMMTIMRNSDLATIRTDIANMATKSEVDDLQYRLAVLEATVNKIVSAFREL